VSELVSEYEEDLSSTIVTWERLVVLPTRRRTGFVVHTLGCRAA